MQDKGVNSVRKAFNIEIPAYKKAYERTLDDYIIIRLTKEQADNEDYQKVMEHLAAKKESLMAFYYKNNGEMQEKEAQKIITHARRSALHIVNRPNLAAAAKDLKQYDKIYEDANKFALMKKREEAQKQNQKPTFKM